MEGRGEERTSVAVHVLNGDEGRIGLERDAVVVAVEGVTSALDGVSKKCLRTYLLTTLSRTVI